MKTILSYCLFEPLVMHSHRTWDENRMEPERYWYNLPSLLVMNDILYPEFETTFYISHSVQYHPLYEVLRHSGVNIEVIDMTFEKTSEPMLWRMFPYWDDIDCFFTRDIDSLPNRDEVRCTLQFIENEEYHIQTIRSHENHYHEQGCDMLGGLSGFKPNKIPNGPSSFDEYYKSRSDLQWAQDQLLMSTTFIYAQDKNYIQEHFLDCPIDNQSRPSAFPCRTIQNLDDIELNEQQEQVLSMVEESGLSTWAGEPCDARGEFTKKLLEMDNDVARKLKELFNDNPKISKVYL
jgi:hypothetical protein